MTAVERLCLAALRHHEYLAQSVAGFLNDDSDRFVAIDVELIESAAAYARSLSPMQRRNLIAKEFSRGGPNRRDLGGARSGRHGGMTDIRTGNALTDGSCMECPPHEDREIEIAEFFVGPLRLQLCPDHARNLEHGLERWRRAR